MTTPSSSARPMHAGHDNSPDARAVALDLFAAVLREQRSLDDALATHRGLRRLTNQDRAFARHLTATMLRRLGQIDTVLDAFMKKPLKGGAKTALDILRLGAAQLLFMNTAAHAAVSTAVDLTTRRGQGRLKGLVNAVLRRVEREGAEHIANQDAARLNTPDWMWDELIAAYGEDRTRAIAEAHQAEPPLDITVKPGTGDEWAERLDAETLPTGTLRQRHGGDITGLAGFAEGAWWIQDAAAALPARLLCNALGDIAGKRVFDLCAAPGGKTLQLAAAGADVVAIDRSESRLTRLHANLKRLGLYAEVAAAKVESWQPSDGRLADAVLLDAPCSATGTLRRHPDVAYLKSMTDVAALQAAQTRMLAAAAALTAPGGVLVYCVCSLLPQEGPAVVEAFLADHKEFSRHPIAASEITGLDGAINAAGELRTLPSQWSEFGGLDGFYAARLVRAV